MTATPCYFKEHVKQRAAELEFEFFQLVSMDDAHVFGPEFHVLTFHEAISAKPEPLLTDYQVVVIGVTDREAKAWAERATLVRTAEGLSSDAGRSDRLGQSDAEIRSAEAHHVPLVGGEGRAVRRCHSARFLAGGRTTHFAHAQITRSVSEGVSTNHRSN